jgi:hypothetical protein
MLFPGRLCLLVQHRRRAVCCKASATPSLSPPSASAPLEMSEGTMEFQSHFYVERPSDHTALAAIERQGITMSIKAPRQMGKSSLLMRIVDAATRQGKRVALLDFQLFEKAALTHVQGV